MTLFSSESRNRLAGFSLVELLVSMACFTIILAVLGQTIIGTLGSWRRSSDRNIQFQEARAAFDSIQARLATAELSPYWGFEYPNDDPSQSPLGYDLLSDLHFVSGQSAIGSGSGGALLTPPLLPSLNTTTHSVFFHGSFGHSEDVAMKGFATLINAWGYYIEFGNDSGDLANFLTTEGGIQPRNRFRLMELQVPSEELTTFQNSLGTPDQLDLDEANSSTDLFNWFRDGIGNNRAVPIAENIIALVLRPLPAQETASAYDPSILAPSYYYDSRANQHSTPPVASALAVQTEHRLPPMIQITLVALSEASAAQLESDNGSTAPSFGLDQLFQDATKHDADLETLKDTLTSNRLTFRVYTNTIRLRNARWN